MTPWKFWTIPFQVKRYKARPASTEGRVWRRYFSEIDYVDETHVTEHMKRYYYSAIKAELRAFNAKRFVNKNPSHCLRLRWLDSMFPDALYILIKREPKAVVHSIYQKMLRYWDMQQDIEYEHGYKGYVTIKEVFGRDVSKLASCVNFYNYINSKLENDISAVQDRLIEVRYEDFIERPREQLIRLYDFSGLSWYPELQKQVPEKLYLENNSKWKTLPSDEQRVLENAFPSDAIAN
jgi:hypothetical protein